MSESIAIGSWLETSRNREAHSSVKVMHIMETPKISAAEDFRKTSLAIINAYGEMFDEFRQLAGRLLEEIRGPLDDAVEKDTPLSEADKVKLQIAKEIRDILKRMATKGQEAAHG